MDGVAPVVSSAEASTAGSAHRIWPNPETAWPGPAVDSAHRHPAGPPPACRAPPAPLGVRRQSNHPSARDHEVSVESRRRCGIL